MRKATWFLVAFVMAVVGNQAAARAAVCGANVMIVLDRSCSMNHAVSATDTRTKWRVAREALGDLIGSNASDLQLGLIMFPDQVGVACEQDGPIAVNVGPATGSAILAAIDGTTPTGPCVTNIDTAVAKVSSDPAFQSVDESGRRGYVLLVTDGKQSSTCGGSARDPTTVANIQALYDAGFPTFVVGFGGAVDPTALGQFAVAGGLPRAGAVHYYQADDAASLEQALSEIAGVIGSDPEFGCSGTPCPDGRCYAAGQICVSGTCQIDPALILDAAPPHGPGADAGPGGDGGGGGGFGDGASGGCGCRAAGGGSAGAPAVIIVLFVGILARRRRR